ncbi:hypothetical protein BS47DRAFT_1378436 [Hydnum rufescens UP504]|uniref:tRNA (guanine(10)-N(2))-methyltransferase n=1 Tax=Hydnum rufescens UP504 TaxID=1448309 RepID=A0A9P6E2C3_9AGAM|nr:hypothetical protein BS47DRAFT_1378436 [Hydnum rufescens UP504]
MDYVLHFALTHTAFRLPELLAVCECLAIDIRLPAEEEERAVHRPFLVVKLESDEEARRLASRCILVKSIMQLPVEIRMAVYALWAQGSTYEELHAANRRSRDVWSKYENSSFRFTVSAVNHTTRKERIRNRPYADTGRERYDGDGNFRHVYFGRLISEGASRPLIGKFDVKKRVFFGNTSMDAEMSLLMANQAQAAPGKFIYDPFAGTGSMLYTAAHFGAFVFGSDMDGRQMRGKDKTPGIYRASAQYGVSSRLMDCATFDVTHNPWRCGDIFDAIVTDPPYGVRAGAKRLGGKAQRAPLRDEPTVLEDGMLAHMKPTYVPPMRPYELSDLAHDLVHFARYFLKPGGRLVFFLPTVTDEYKDVDIPVCEGMTIVANSLQDFGKWGRRLITMVKTAEGEVEAPRFDGSGRRASTEPESAAGSSSSPAHYNFRVKYFSGFRPGPP